MKKWIRKMGGKFDKNVPTHLKVQLWCRCRRARVHQAEPLWLDVDIQCVQVNYMTFNSLCLLSCKDMRLKITSYVKAGEIIREITAVWSLKALGRFL